MIIAWISDTDTQKKTRRSGSRAVSSIAGIKSSTTALLMTVPRLFPSVFQPAYASRPSESDSEGEDDITKVGLHADQELSMKQRRRLEIMKNSEVNDHCVTRNRLKRTKDRAWVRGSGPI